MKNILALVILTCSPLTGFALDKNTQARIETLVQNNPNQLSVAEYSYIAEKVIASAPCNFLVFGLGNDSQLWIDLNKGGQTIFLEDNPQWFRKCQDNIPDLNAYLVKYDTVLNQWKNLLHEPGKLRMKLPAPILKTKWDIIFVDAPAGYGDNPGRMQSIFMASWLAQQTQKTHVYVHDCNRPAEAAYTTEYLKPVNLIRSIDRLRHYYIKK